MHVLLIEDNEDDVCLIREMLLEKQEGGIQLEWVDRLSRGLTQLAEGKSDLVLLDLSLPDSQGLETFNTVQRCAQDVPIVVLTGLDDEAMANQAVRGGAQDYLVKGRSDGSGLVRAIQVCDRTQGVGKGSARQCGPTTRHQRWPHQIQIVLNLC